MGALLLANQRRSLVLLVAAAAGAGFGSPYASAPEPGEPPVGPVQGQRFPAGPHPLRGVCPAWNDGFNRFNSAIFIRNASDNPTSITVSYFDSSGNSQGTSVNTTVPGGRATGYATGAETTAPTSVAGNLGVPSGSVGSTVVYGSEPLTGSCMNWSRNPSMELRALSITPLLQNPVPAVGPYLATTSGRQSTLATRLFVPLIFQSSTNQRSTNLQIQNTGSSSTTVQLEFFDDSNASDGYLTLDVPGMQSRLLSQSNTIPSPLLSDASAGSNSDMFFGSAIISSPSVDIAATVLAYGFTAPPPGAPGASATPRDSTSTLEFTADSPALVPGSFLETFVAGILPTTVVGERR